MQSWHNVRQAKQANRSEGGESVTGQVRSILSVVLFVILFALLLIVLIGVLMIVRVGEVACSRVARVTFVLFSTCPTTKAHVATCFDLNSFSVSFVQLMLIAGNFII